MTAATAGRSPHAINLRWILRLRWGAMLGQAAMVLLAERMFGLDLPLDAVFGVIALECASNVVCLIRCRNRDDVEGSLVALMALDVLFLTVLLHLTGGSFNPFNFLYLVYVALAAVVLRPVFTWSLVSLSLACFGTLFAGLPGMDPPSHIHHAEQMDMHLRGMWVAFAVAAGFIVYFVDRIRRALAERDVELERSRNIAAHRERLAALGTLAAGAAHELATPLGTIALAAGEMRAALERGRYEAVGDDASLIEEQVKRCRAILDQMAGVDAPGEAPTNVTLGELGDNLVSRMRPVGTVELALDPPVRDVTLVAPRRAVEQAVRALIKNAVDASEGRTVTVSGGFDAERAWIQVKDEGVGMPPEIVARLGEPFFTTKEPGSGMGLGLYLANALAEQLGGHLEFDSAVGLGTTARFVLPRVT